MALLAKRPFAECLLELKDPSAEQASVNHIFEPEFHQEVYRNAGELAKAATGSFQIGDPPVLRSCRNGEFNRTISTMKMMPQP